MFSLKWAVNRCDWLKTLLRAQRVYAYGIEPWDRAMRSAGVFHSIQNATNATSPTARFSVANPQEPIPPLTVVHIDPIPQHF